MVLIFYFKCSLNVVRNLFQFGPVINKDYQYPFLSPPPPPPPPPPPRSFPKKLLLVTEYRPEVTCKISLKGNNSVKTQLPVTKT